MADRGINPIAAALNSRPKYVASTTLTEPRWVNTTVLSSKFAAAVRELRAKSGGELQVHGSGALIRWLLDNDLVDELNLLIFPVIVGQGTRLFPDNGQDQALELLESQATPRGVTIQAYRPTGRLQVGTATADLKHVRKIRHREGRTTAGDRRTLSNGGRQRCRGLDSMTDPQTGQTR